MQLAVSSDECVGISEVLVERLEKLGHQVKRFGALGEGCDTAWSRCSEQAARAVVEGDCEQAVICCWTGTGASIAANKVKGVRAALCTDAQTAAGARRWNDANVLVLSLRLTSEAVLDEMLEAWFNTQPSSDQEDQKNIQYVSEIE